MRPQDLRHIEMAAFLFLALQDREHIIYALCLRLAGRPEEPVLPPELYGELLDARTLCGIAKVAGEHEHLEARVGGADVLDVDSPSVRHVQHDLRKDALPDDQVRGSSLVGRGRQDRLCVVDAGARREGSERLEGPVSQRKTLREIRENFCCESILQEFLVCHTVSVFFRLRLSGEKCGELLVEGYEVLCVFPSLKLVLRMYVR